MCLSSGVIVDEGDCIDRLTNKFKLTECPVSGTKIEKKAFPVHAMKAIIAEWRCVCFDKALELSKKLTNYPKEFERATMLAQKILRDLGDEN